MDQLCYLCCVFVMFLSVHCSLVVTCWERADILAVLCVMSYCVIVTFPCGVLGKVWCFIVSITVHCFLPYFENLLQHSNMVSKI